MTTRWLGSTVARGAAGVRRHSLVAGGMTFAAVAAAMVARRLGGSSDYQPGALAEATAISVWDAAKASVIERAREAGEGAEPGVVTAPTRDAVRDAAAAGADVTAAALGAVDGAVSVAELLGGSPAEVAAIARAAAVSAAQEVGEGANLRVVRALRDRYGAGAN